MSEKEDEVYSFKDVTEICERADKGAEAFIANVMYESGRHVEQLKNDPDLKKTVRGLILTVADGRAALKEAHETIFVDGKPREDIIQDKDDENILLYTEAVSLAHEEAHKLLCNISSGLTDVMTDFVGYDKKEMNEFKEKTENLSKKIDEAKEIKLKKKGRKNA